jgi:AraC-like DNA-binding protein
MLMTAADDKFWVVRFDTNDVPEKDRIAFVRDIYGRTIVKYDIEAHPDSPFHWHGVLRSLPGLGVATTVCSGVHTTRTHAPVDCDDLVINVTLAGKRIVRQLGREAVVGPGQVAMTRSRHAASSDCDPNSRLTDIRIPVSALSPAIIDLDDVLARTIPAGTEPLPLLLGYLDVLPHADTLDAPETRHLVVEHVHDLVMLMLGATSTAKGRGVRAARLQAIKDDIAANVGRRDLSLGGIAARLGVSTRYVSMLFKDEGTTFTQFVLEARLRCAHRLLNNPRKISQPINAIALECGFGDLSYFNQSFRRRYGATPTEVRKAARWQGDD